MSSFLVSIRLLWNHRTLLVINEQRWCVYNMSLPNNSFDRLSLQQHYSPSSSNWIRSHWSFGFFLCQPEELQGPRWSYGDDTGLASPDINQRFIEQIQSCQNCYQPFTKMRTIMMPFSPCSWHVKFKVFNFSSGSKCIYLPDLWLYDWLT